jgi:hypothetical protein
MATPQPSATRAQRGRCSVPETTGSGGASYLRTQNPWASMPRATLNLLRLSPTHKSLGTLHIASLQIVADRGPPCHPAVTANKASHRGEGPAAMTAALPCPRTPHEGTRGTLRHAAPAGKSPGLASASPKTHPQGPVPYRGRAWLDL